MKLQTGKKYRRRDGATVEIVRMAQGVEIFKFIGVTEKCRHHYAENGRFFSVAGPEHKFDIVEEV